VFICVHLWLTKSPERLLRITPARTTRRFPPAIRAAVLEDSDLPGTPEFEDALVRLAEGMLTSGAAPAS
jgi:hypothetical protein